MKERPEAICEDGALKPLEGPALSEHQQMVVELREPAEEEATRTLAAWQSVYEGLSVNEIREVERVALARSSFTRNTP